MALFWVISHGMTLQSFHHHHHLLYIAKATITHYIITITLLRQSAKSQPRSRLLLVLIVQSEARVMLDAGAGDVVGCQQVSSLSKRREAGQLPLRTSRMLSARPFDMW